MADFCSKLRIRDIVDAACPVGELAELTHGQVIEVLIANRLTSPARWCTCKPGRRTGRLRKRSVSIRYCSTMIGSAGRSTRSPRTSITWSDRSGWS
ncbi:hypothetical protein [Sphaerisporangium flaviroseum]|uniref:hypothetical protein n=1 Tax=Sphaerisporangium flaviroseum TaxID=509199 RepID=UPI003CD0B5BB